MIELGQPLALLAALAVPVIIALHMLRPRRRRVVLSTVSLWQQALRERRRGLGLQKLLRNIALLMLLAAAALSALALSGPQWLTRTSERNDVVLVIDVSASMSTETAGVSRLERAVEAAETLLARVGDEARVLIMTSGRGPVLRSGFEADRLKLRRILAALSPSHEVGRPREALALAVSLLRNREAGHVHFFTDGAFDDDVDLGSPRVTYHHVGSADAINVAITRFDFRPELGRDDRFEVLLSVRNYAKTAQQVPASASLGGITLFRRTLSLAAGEESTLVLPFRGAAVGVARARIEVNDDLSADNAAYAAVNARDALQVLLVGAGNVYLESVLNAAPRLDYSRVDDVESDDISRLARLYDVIIFDGVSPPPLPKGNFLLINALAPGLPFQDVGAVTNPVVTSRGSSALLRNVDLGAVRIEQARALRVPDAVDGLTPLFWSEDTTLALSLIDEHRRLVYLGFDLARSNFPLQAAFPLFFSQSLAWLRPREDRIERTQIQAGERYVIRAPVSEPELIMRHPSGDASSYALRDGVLRFDDTTLSGVYRYTVSDVRRYFAVNLTDARESDVSSRARLPASPAPAADNAALSWSTLDLWPSLTLFALLLLIGEWLLRCFGRSDA